MGIFSRKKIVEHKVIELNKLMRLSGEVEDIAKEGLVSAEEMDDLSADLGVPREQVYAGLGMSGSARIRLEHDVAFVVCTGGCQGSGALACVGELLDRRDDLVDDGSPAFDVVTTNCLNRCQVAPVVEIRSSDGTAVLAKASPESVSQAVDELFE